jgi:3-oxoacyl-[acyl-carrier protein] reductase
MSSGGAGVNEPVAIVTGGGTGIGAAAARLFAERGTTVALVGRRRDLLAAVAGEITVRGGRALPVPADLAEAGAAHSVVDRVLSELGRIDILINNAATIKVKPFDQFTVADFDEHVAVNMRSIFFLIQAALPALRRSPSPAIVNVSSSVGSMIRIGNALYGMTKAGIEYPDPLAGRRARPRGHSCERHHAGPGRHAAPQDVGRRPGGGVSPVDVRGAAWPHGDGGRGGVVDCPAHRTERVVGHGPGDPRRRRPDPQRRPAALG